MTRLFDTYPLEELTLRNRVVIAPMTRARCTGTVPTEQTAECYRQRAGAEGYLDYPTFDPATV